MLKAPRDAAGAAPVETIFAMVLLAVLALGVLQVGLTLYGRNVVMASAHEAARAAIERGRSPADARVVAEQVVRGAAGRLLQGVRVAVRAVETEDGTAVVVDVRGTIRPLGPVPMPFPVHARASAGQEPAVR